MQNARSKVRRCFASASGKHERVSQTPRTTPWLLLKKMKPSRL